MAMSAKSVNKDLEALVLPQLIAVIAYLLGYINKDGVMA